MYKSHGILFLFLFLGFEFHYILHHFSNYFYRAIIDSQVWVALNFTFLCWFFQKINSWNQPDLLLISFFATLFTYNLAHSKGITEEKWRIPVLVISFSAVMYFSFNSLPLTSILILSFLGIISILYSIQIRKLQLRRMPGFKIFWIALVWSVAVFLPWIEVLQPTIWMVIPQWLSVLCFVLAISIPFDIRDVYYDEPALSTFPQKFGIQASVRLSTQLLMLSAALFLIGFQFELNQITHAFLINILISILLIRKMLRPRNFWFTDLWIEGLSGLFLVIYFILGL